MHEISEILDELRGGRMIVLVDDEKRENEGDLVVAAEFATPEAVNFMLREGRGMMCVALSSELCDRLELSPQSTVNTSQRSTAYTVTVDADARFGVTTGVSAGDRSCTIRRLVSEEAKPGDFARPGHVQPLRAREGGTLVRVGQTEGSVDLCRLAGLKQGAVIIEVMNDDGSMARRPELERLCAKHDLKMCSVADVIHHRLERDLLIERIAEHPFHNEVGDFRLIAYRSRVDPFPHVALVKGDVGRLDPLGDPIDHDEPVLVRMHSQNLLGDVFGDTSQPSGDTLRQAMRMIEAAGSGAVVYLRHEGMGKGLLKQLQTPTPIEGGGEDEDRPQLGQGPEMTGESATGRRSDYGIGSQILRDLGVRKMRLITSHPMTPTALSGFGLEITEFVDPA